MSEWTVQSAVTQEGEIAMIASIPGSGFSYRETRESWTPPQTVEFVARARAARSAHTGAVRPAPPSRPSADPSRASKRASGRSRAEEAQNALRNNP